MKIIQLNRPPISMKTIKILMRGLKKKKMLKHLQNF